MVSWNVWKPSAGDYKRCDPNRIGNENFNEGDMPKRTSKEYDRFIALTNRLLAVPHSEIQKRISEHREAAAKNPRKRGPKPKTA